MSLEYTHLIFVLYYFVGKIWIKTDLRQQTTFDLRVGGRKCSAFDWQHQELINVVILEIKMFLNFIDRKIVNCLSFPIIIISSRATATIKCRVEGKWWRGRRGVQQDDHHPPYALPIGGCCLIAITRTKSSSLPVQIQFVGGGEEGRVQGHEKIMGKLAGKCGGYIIITQEETIYTAWTYVFIVI